MRNVIPCIAALTAASCSAPMMNVDECPEVIADSWSVIHWSSSDGTSGTTGCHGPLRWFATVSETTGRTEMWGEQNSGDAIPVESRVHPRPFGVRSVQMGPPSIEFQNYSTASGTRGPVGLDRYPPPEIATALTPNLFLWLRGCAPGAPACDLETEAVMLHPRPGGTFEFAVGGTWGDVVELVVRDVTWDLASGESFTIEEGTWHYRLPAAPEPRP